MPGARGAAVVGARTARPSTRSRSATPIAPGRSSAGPSPVNPTIVDSIPTAHGPPSRMIDSASPRSSATCCAVVGEMRPKRLADGAAIPPPNSARSARATGCEGTRMPTLSCPPVIDVRDVRRARQDQRQRPRPESRGELARPVGNGTRPLRELRCVVQVNDDGMIGGSPLRGEDLAHRVRASGVGAEPVDGLGRKRDQLARAQARGRPRDRRPIRAFDDGAHRALVSCVDKLVRPAPKPGGARIGAAWGARWESARIQTFAGCAQSCASTAQGSGNE